ncbi:hypothetical protein [Chthonobacter albigriseus]|uniref:hypothetical protein n=1 Tax=Chthonobacter albigriseus TaxID=1683161 RepID=UPI0015EECFCD|nr:hypothetical protein [Chthonobacter albigriseus]
MKGGTVLHTAALIALFYEPSRVKRTVDVIRSLDLAHPHGRLVCVINGTRITPDVLRAALGGLAARSTILVHDNSGMEFGGYQAGLDQLAAGETGRLVILNDTIGSHQHLSGRSVRALSAALHAEQEANFVVGPICHSARLLRIGGLSGSRWIRSNLIGFDNAAVEAIGRRVFDPALDASVRGGADPQRFFAETLDPSVAGHIGAWLFSQTGTRWYRAEPLSSANAELMAMKARAVLHELNLSLRLDAAGAAFREPVLRAPGRWIEKIELRLFAKGGGH